MARRLDLGIVDDVCATGCPRSYRQAERGEEKQSGGASVHTPGNILPFGFGNKTPADALPRSPPAETVMPS